MPGGGGPAFGKLRVTIVAARGLPEPTNGSGRDPYVKVRIGPTEFATNPTPNGAKNPKFGSEFQFDIGAGVPRELDLEVWFKQPSGQDIRACTARQGYLGWVDSGTFSGDIDLMDPTR